MVMRRETGALGMWRCRKGKRSTGGGHTDDRGRLQKETLLGVVQVASQLAVAPHSEPPIRLRVSSWRADHQGIAVVVAAIAAAAMLAVGEPSIGCPVRPGPVVGRRVKVAGGRPFECQMLKRPAVQCGMVI